MEKILFIVNPLSGNRPRRFREEYLPKYLDLNRFSYEVYVTRAAGDGNLMVRTRLDEFDGFVAVGGDGTVNEVFQALIGTDKWLSVIPNGSGNGLARALGIPMGLAAAIRHLSKGVVRPIDYGIINGECFINVAGIGFDARVASKFKKSKTRGLQTYAQITLREFKKFKTRKVKITLEDKTVKRRVLLASFANSSEFGNNAHIAPNARLDDGKLRIVTFKKFHWLSFPYLAWLLFNKALDRSQLYREYVIEKAIIRSKKNIHLHIDGEARGKVKKIELQVVAGGVRILA